MIERVAKATNDTMLTCGDYKPIGLARAAIAAMREPSEAMRLAGDLNDTYDFTVAWQPMIDAALGETKSTTKGKLL